ncbi:pollen-specific leucine-rich repeat extensin-like protein 4 [Iris pallida]|uniref:Pollen-specific leucine-rich repeat extensin-like protein 4 n=1 Tax=Iris pallida TaxID=29817 RepID=A0AAX6H5L2_IRIPA|nr:pollen-specific leucine-rich repeat extensin-like protein 4 [Iris pallida]
MARHDPVAMDQPGRCRSGHKREGLCWWWWATRCGGTQRCASGRDLDIHGGAVPCSKEEGMEPLWCVRVRLDHRKVGRWRRDLALLNPGWHGHDGCRSVVRPALEG